MRSWSCSPGWPRPARGPACAAAVLAERASDDPTARRRIAAARALPQVLDDGSSISALLMQACTGIVEAAERALAGGEADLPR
jgi:hypothetical protein